MKLARCCKFNYVQFINTIRAVHNLLTQQESLRNSYCHRLYRLLGLFLHPYMLSMIPQQNTSVNYLGTCLWCKKRCSFLWISLAALYWRKKNTKALMCLLLNLPTNLLVDKGQIHFRSRTWSKSEIPQNMWGTPLRAAILFCSWVANISPLLFSQTHCDKVTKQME